VKQLISRLAACLFSYQNQVSKPKPLRPNVQKFFLVVVAVVMGRDSSVGKATRYGLDGSVSNPGGGARYSAPVQTRPRAHPASYTKGTGSFPEVKRPGRGVDHSPPSSSAKVKERVELYLYSTYGPSWPVLG
jgi:hypothetical protein